MVGVLRRYRVINVNSPVGNIANRDYPYIMRKGYALPVLHYCPVGYGAALGIEIDAYFYYWQT